MGNSSAISSELFWMKIHYLIISYKGFRSKKFFFRWIHARKTIRVVFCGLTLVGNCIIMLLFEKKVKLILFFFVFFLQKGHKN